MLLAVQKSLAETMKGWQVCNVGEGKGEVRWAVKTSGQNEVLQAFRDPGFCQDVL